MEAVRTSETSVDNLFTRQYNPEDSSEQLYLVRELGKDRIYSIPEAECLVPVHERPLLRGGIVWEPLL
jgi:hypothetical protein